MKGWGYYKMAVKSDQKILHISFHSSGGVGQAVSRAVDAWEARAIECIRISIAENPISNTLKIIALLFKNKGCPVHVHQHFAAIFLLPILLLSRRPKTLFVYTHISTIVANKKISGRVFVIISKWVYMAFDRIIAPNQEVEADLRTIFKEENNSKVKVAYPVFLPPPNSSMTSRYSNKSKLILCVGALVKNKNWDLALRAFAESGLEEYELWVIGSGEEGKALEELATSLEIVPRCKFLGRQAPENVIQSLFSAEILLHTSLFEGHPNVIVEAMFCKTKVCCTPFLAGAKSLVTSNVGNVAQDFSVASVALALRNTVSLEADNHYMDRVVELHAASRYTETLFQ